MAKNDWFRKTTWTEDDKTDFYAHVRRCRSAGAKAQYLRIQAGYLHGIGSEYMTREALTLLDQMLADYPASLDRAQALLQKAECIYSLGCLDDSLVFYRAALQKQRESPRVGTSAWLGFGWTVVQHRLRHLYSEALTVLEEFKPGLLFEADKFRLNAIKAIIAHDRGHADSARAFALIALGAASQQHSGFRYHPTAGLVRDSDKSSDIYDALRRLSVA